MVSVCQSQAGVESREDKSDQAPGPVVTGQSRETFFQPQFVTSGHVTLTWPRPAGHHTGLFPDHMCNNVSSMDRGPSI